MRKKILDNLFGIDCEVIKSKDKEISNKNNLFEYVIELSQIKANSAAKQIGNEKCLIIAADTIICMNNKKFEKPKNKEEAFQNIKTFSGNVNYALTGVTIKDLYQQKEISFFDKTDVYYKNVDDEDIKWYVETDDHI